VTETIETEQDDNNITVEEVDQFTAMCYETMESAAANACADRPEMETEFNGNVPTTSSSSPQLLN
jgi:hypothetical protein